MCRRKLTTEQFINKAKNVHGDKYDYSNTTYLGALLKVNISCSVHGVFSQTANGHLMGQGCPTCNRLKDRTDVSNIIVPAGSKAVPLTKGKYALVDEEDYERVMEHNWLIVTGYVTAIISDKNVKMHRLIMNVSDPNILVDHKFHNKLDNRKSQLRLCNNTQNVRNRKPNVGSLSRFKGVNWNKNKKKWVSEIMCDGVRYFLGLFENEIEAARAYDKKAKELFGEFAYLNFK